MKTTTDIAQFLKRITAAREGLVTPLILSFDGKQFTAKTADHQQQSKYLDDALCNLLEEYRRADSGSGPMRDKPAEPKPATTTTAPANPYMVNGVVYPQNPSISQAAQQVWQQGQHPASSPCPTCGAPRAGTMVMTYGKYAYCAAAHYWIVA